MDFEQLKSFCTVAQYKSFLKSAEILQITQPAVSRRIKSLENEMGVLLLKRTPQAVSLTEAGANFLPFAERILKILEQGTKTTLEGKNLNHLIIAASTSNSNYLVPKILQGIDRDRIPFMTIHTTPSFKVLDMLLDQTIDIGFTTFEVYNPLIHCDQIFEEEIVCLANDEIAEEYFDNGSLKKIPVPTIFNNNNRTPYSIINDYLLQSSDFKIVMKADSAELVKILAEQGYGIGFLPLSDCINHFGKGLIKKIPLERTDFEIPRRPVYLLTHKEGRNIEATNQFKKVAKIALADEW